MPEWGWASRLAGLWGRGEELGGGGSGGLLPQEPFGGSSSAVSPGSLVPEGLLTPQAGDIGCVVGAGHAPAAAPSLAPRRSQSGEGGVQQFPVTLTDAENGSLGHSVSPQEGHPPRRGGRQMSRRGTGQRGLSKDEGAGSVGRR